MSKLDRRVEELETQVDQLKDRNHDLVKAFAVLAEMFRRFDHQINFSPTPTREAAGHFDLTMDANDGQRGVLDLDVRYLDDNTVQIRFLDCSLRRDLESSNIEPSQKHN